MDRDDLRFAVLGAGMAGVLSAIKLREAGCGDVVVYEEGRPPRGHGGSVPAAWPWSVSRFREVAAPDLDDYDLV